MISFCGFLYPTRTLLDIDIICNINYATDRLRNSCLSKDKNFHFSLTVFIYNLGKKRSWKFVEIKIHYLISTSIPTVSILSYKALDGDITKGEIIVILSCRNFDSILRIPIPSSRNSSISYIPNIIALSIMESQQLLLQATILHIEKVLKVLLQDTGIQRESIYLPNSNIISFSFYMFHYPTISSILSFKLLLNLMTVL